MPNPDTSRRLLLVTNRLQSSPQGGRELLCRLNYDALRAILGDRLFLYELPKRKLAGLGTLLGAFRGWIDGLDAGTLHGISDLIAALSIREVFIDGSNLGTLAAAIKASRPEVRVTTFFHNVEARFFWGAWRSHKTLHALGVLLANTLAERKAVKCSDKLICLCERDSRLLNRLYGRGATHIAPMVLEDKYPVSDLHTTADPPDGFALFVGGSFYANRAGIAWFVREVVPRIDLPIYIVGRGFEATKSELEIPGKVIVVGAVDSLADWYRRAKFVIAPIFDGSGMKTKVAEALMHGKKIIGTPEAFTGYEDIIDQAGWVCHSADEFEAAIVTAAREVTNSFNTALRQLYLDNYSFEAGRLRYMFILQENLI